MAVIKSATGQMAISSSRNYLIKEHLHGPSVGIKNWPGCVSRYKFYRCELIVSDSVNLLTAVAREPIFYMRAGRRIRLAFCVSRYKFDKRPEVVLSR
jgi:hypothetical protein